MSKGKVDLSSPVARVVKPFGKEGEAIVALFDNFPEDYDTREPLFVVIDGLTVPLFFDRFDRRGNRKAVVLFADFYAEKRVAELVGHELFCSPSGTAETEYESDEENDDAAQTLNMRTYRLKITYTVEGKSCRGRYELYASGDNHERLRAYDQLGKGDVIQVEVYRSKNGTYKLTPDLNPINFVHYLH